MRWLILLTLTLAAAAQEYFPMHLGDSWIYRGPGEALTAIPIDRMEGEYFVFKQQESAEGWLRRDEKRILERDRTSGEEHVLYDFAAPGGTEAEYAAPFGASKILSIPFEQ